MLSEQPRVLLIFADTVYAMEPNKGKESGEMYSPDDQGEYMPEVSTLSFSIQWLSDALTALDTEVTMVQSPSEEYALLLEVTMADCPGCPCLPTFSWNVGMVMLKPSGTMWERHSLSGSPTLHTYLSFSFHWQKGGARQLLHQNGATRGLDQSIEVVP